MPRAKTLPAAALCGLTLILPGAALAQVPGAVYTVTIPAGQFGSDRFTDLLVNSLAATRQFCGALGDAYQVDCLAERLGNLAGEIPEGTDYDEVRQVLEESSAEIARLARANRDSAQPRQSASAGGSIPQATTRPLTPVRAESLPSVKAEAAAILERTETVLLRSPDDGNGKKLHYTRIAEAIGSNKTLLRS